MLIHFGIIPYIVFDGDYLPSKASTEGARAEKRADSKRVGLELYRMGKLSQAHLELQKAVDVTPEMAGLLIEELKRHNIQYVVAPYEADAQLVFLERKDIIQGIISEDSDMLVFGAKRLLTKLDQYGDCIEINRDDFTACREISLVGWSDAEFRRMAILSGCDYLANINKMGLRTAYRLVRKYKTIEKILRIIQLDSQYRVPLGYLENFRRAELTFLHQRVFCPHEKKVVMATDLGAGPQPEDLAFIGKHVEADLALGVARGDLHPMTKEPIIIRTETRLVSNKSWATSRRQSVGTPSDLKPKVSIESFFKSQRTPLAELDPNSFSPSPSQQRLLAHQTGIFSSSPVPSRIPLSRSSTSLPASSRPLMPLSGNRTSVSTKVSASVPHPPKRQRLCEGVPPTNEVLPPFGSARIEVGRSRFFSSSIANSSPSNKRHGKNRPRTEAINIWSDDSIDEVMLGLPDVIDSGEILIKDQNFAVYNDCRDPEDDSPLSHGSLGVKISQSSMLTSSPLVGCSITIPSTTSSTSRSSASSSRLIIEQDQMENNRQHVAPLEEGSLALHIPKNFTSLATSRFKIQPARENVSRQPLSQLKCTTALQPLGNSTLARSPPRFEKMSTNLSTGTIPGKATVGSFHCEVPCSPDVKVAAGKGSEDFLVTNSEDDLDGQLTSESEDATTSKLDLSRFAYGG